MVLVPPQLELKALPRHRVVPRRPRLALGLDGAEGLQPHQRRPEQGRPRASAAAMLTGIGKVLEQMRELASSNVASETLLIAAM